MIRLKTNAFRISKQYFPALLMLILLSGCASLSHIDRAQDEFNKGAQIENAALLNQSVSLVSPPQPADYFYKRAYAEVKKGLASEGKLKKLELFVNAATIKALCEWKLKDYDAAQKTAKSTLDYINAKNIAVETIPRDFAVLSAMSALIGIETMNEKQSTFFGDTAPASDAAVAEYKKIIHKEAGQAGNIVKNLEDLDAVSNRVPKNHEVQTYLVMSKLSALKVWSDALNGLRTTMKKNGNFSGNNQDFFDSEKTKLEDAKGKYAKALRDQIGKEHDIYKHWNLLLGFQ